MLTRKRSCKLWEAALGYPILTVEQARAICAEVNDMGIEDWWEWRSELDRRLCAVTAPGL